MKFFRSNRNKELTELLKNSSGEFRFDPEKIKYRLLSSINQLHQNPAHHHFRFTRVIKYSVSFAGMVIVLSSTFAFASSSKPGDKLFALNKAGERVVLSLPMPSEQKAQVQAYIVTQRFEALDEVEVQAETRNLETVKESDETLTSAIDRITENKKQLESRGKTKSAEKLETVLDQLQITAEKREKKIMELQEKTTDKDAKRKIEEHLKQIRKSREKAQLEIRRYRLEKTIDDNNDDNRGQ